MLMNQLVVTKKKTTDSPKKKNLEKSQFKRKNTNNEYQGLN